MDLTLIKKEQVTPDVTTFIFEKPADFTWTAGQYLHYKLPHPDMDNRGEKRHFTIASAPYEGVIQLTSRFAGEKGSSFKKTLASLEVGQTIEAYKVEGDFVIDDSKKEYVFIAGGIGITPFRAILLDLAHRGEPLNITLLYANRDQNIVFKEELEALQKDHPEFKINYVIDPDRIDEEYLKSFIINPQPASPAGGSLFYISGPAPMVFGLAETLEKLGVSETQIKTDDFPGYA